MKYKFIDYLKEMHDQNYAGTADDAPDDFEHWLDTLIQDEVIDYADAFAERTLVNANNAAPIPSPYMDGNIGGVLVVAH